jgi:starvation-inducible DNA-binding protein
MTMSHIPSRRGRALEIVYLVLAAVALAFSIVMLAAYFQLSQAHEHNHPPADAAIHEKLYPTCMMPDDIQEETKMMNIQDAKARRKAPLATPHDLNSEAVRDLSGALNVLLADMFALYVKTKNFHWHVSGSHFRDYHLLLDEQAEQIFATTDAIAERVRKIGGTTLRSIGEIGRRQRVLDNDADFVTPLDMLAELRDDNKQLTANLRETHGLCDEHGDLASASLLETWIDEAERRTWFLFEAGRVGETAGRS